MESEYWWLVNVLVIVASAVVGIWLIGQAHFVAVMERRRGRRGGDAVMVVVAGVSGSGKTVLWHRLVSGGNVERIETVGSSRARVEKFVPSAEGVMAEELFGTIAVADTPGEWACGEARVVTELLTDPSSCALIFCINATDLDSFRESAAYLFALISSPVWQKRPQPFCLYFSQTDLAHPAEGKYFVRNRFEAEVQRIFQAYQPDQPDPNWHRRFFRYLLRPIWRQKIKNPPLRILNNSGTVFRFQNLITPLFLLLWEINPAHRADQCRAFIQRAAILHKTAA